MSTKQFLSFVKSNFMSLAALSKPNPFCLAKHRIDYFTEISQLFCRAKQRFVLCTGHKIPFKKIIQENNDISLLQNKEIQYFFLMRYLASKL